MSAFVIDEDMPRSTGPALAARGYPVKDIRDFGLRGADDGTVFQFAQTHRAVLLTGDLGFSNPIRFPLGRHCGIVIARFPNELSTAEVNRHLLDQLTTVTDEEYSGHVIIVEVGRIRIRRA